MRIHKCFVGMPSSCSFLLRNFISDLCSIGIDYRYINKRIVVARLMMMLSYSPPSTVGGKRVESQGGNLSFGANYTRSIVI